MKASEIEKSFYSLSDLLSFGYARFSTACSGAENIFFYLVCNVYQFNDSGIIPFELHPLHIRKTQRRYERKHITDHTYLFAP